MQDEPGQDTPIGEAVLVDWAVSLLRAGAEDIEDAIEVGLRRVAQAMGAAGAVTFRFASDASHAEGAFEWRMPGLPSLRGGRYLRSEVGATFAALQAGEPVVLHVDQPPVDFQGLRAVMGEQGSTAAMLFPIHQGGPMTWILVFEWRDTVPRWRAAHEAFGLRAAEVLRAGLDRHRELQEQAETQSRMLERQKLESLGVMAGGIVHDFNNVLQTVLGLSEFLTGQLPAGELREMAELIGAAAGRAADLTHRFLVFSRQDVRERQNISTASSLASILQLVRRTVPEDRTIRLTADPSAGKVFMSPIDFEQAIINLCNNASAAMPRGGTIAIDCRAAPDDADWVEITVRDDGEGMGPEALARACDLFYTTKPPGEGTGLGLPMVRRTVESVGGQLAIESAPGVGTTVRLRLPKSTRSDVRRDEDSGPPVTGDETILLVEDDSFVRRVARSHLEKAGFTVVPAADGAKALELYRANRDDIDAVVTDIIMPGLGGVALHEAISAEGRPPPFLFASGYDAGALSAEFLSGPDRDFVGKPYQAQQMLRRLRRLLDGRQTGSKEA